MRRIWLFGLLTSVFLLAPAAQAQLPTLPPPAMPRGLVSNTSAATPGYVLFSPTESTTVFLIANDGNVVHSWENEFGGLSHYPEANGTILRGFRDPTILHFRQGGVTGGLQEIAWDGSVLWEWKRGDEKQVLHHDVERLPNGNILVLGWELKTPEQARKVGRRKAGVPEKGLMPEFLLEIEPTRPGGAKIVWEWHVWDHLTQDHDAKIANHGKPSEHPERLDINAGVDVSAISPQELEQLKALGYVDDDADAEDLKMDFLHANAVEYNAAFDQIAISVPSLGEIWILDHSTSTDEARTSKGGRAGKGGDLLYRWGNPSTYGRGDASATRLFFQHDVRWIPEGYERAGNLTIFNNGRDRPAGPFSSVDEIKPPLKPDGTYAIEDGKAYGPTELAWTAKLPADRFAPFISGAERLKNGNTFACAGTDGRLLELSPAGEIVWEYRNPFGGSLVMADGKPATAGSDERPYAVFRATRIPTDHPFLKDRTLKPLDPQPKWTELPEKFNGEKK
jgi:hypothetical protein